MCTLLVTPNLDDISHALASPSFLQRGTHGVTVHKVRMNNVLRETSPWGFMNVTEKNDWEHPDEDQWPSIYVAHAHSPTGHTYGKHPAVVRRVSPDNRYELTGFLWHNGQVVNQPYDRWDTQDIAEGLLYKDLPTVNGIITPSNLIDWGSLDSIEGTFACVFAVMITHKVRFTNVSQGALFFFRNAMSPLVYRDTDVAVSAERDGSVSPNKRLFLDSDRRNYIGSVPLAGHEKQVKNIQKNVVYSIAPVMKELAGNTRTLELSKDDMVLAANQETTIENMYNPYGV